MAYVYQRRRKDGSLDPVWRIQFRDWAGRKKKVKGLVSKRETEGAHQFYGDSGQVRGRQ